MIIPLLSPVDFKPAEWSSLDRILAPTQEPITLGDLRDTEYLRDIDIDHESQQIESFIKAARETAEAQTSRKFLTQTWRAAFDCYPCRVDFPFGQLQAVDAVRVIQADGTADIQDTDRYTVTTGDNGILWKRTDNGTDWTETERKHRFFEIDFTVGWADPDSIPEEIINGIKRILAMLYYNRDNPDFKVPGNIFHGSRRILF